MPTSTCSAFFIALTWRIFTATTTQTFFQPDEFYQSLEVAHHAVFGYGRLTWEWTTDPPIRSIVFPALYMPVYWLLKVTGTDDTELLIVAPKVLQGVFAALTDISTRKLAKEIFGDRYANTAFYLSLCSFFHLLCLGRTLSNSVETSLTTAALCFWPWHSTEKNESNITIAMVLAATSCMLRPTSAVLWVFLALNLLWRSKFEAQLVRSLIMNTTFIGALSMLTLYITDSWYFQKPTFTPLNFVITNLSSVSSFYGLNEWHYYLSQGLPILLNVYLPFFGWGSWTVLKYGQSYQKALVYLIVWTVGVYSLLGHKEWRFLHPVLPVSLTICSKAMVDSDTKMGKEKVNNCYKKWTVRSLSFHKIMSLLSVVIGGYVIYFHGRAQINVMSYLRSLDTSELKSVGFLMPCHSTPWQSHLHKQHLALDGYLWTLGCEPPLHKSYVRGEDISDYQDQSDVFYFSPLTYLRTNFPDTVDPGFPPSPFPSTKAGGPPPADNRWDHRWPSHLVFFGALLEDGNHGSVVENYLKDMGYSEIWVGYNGFEEDWRRRGGVRVWRWHTTP